MRIKPDGAQGENSLIASGSGDFNEIMGQVQTVMNNTLGSLTTELTTCVENLKESMKGAECKWDSGMKFQTIIEPNRIVFSVETNQSFVKDK